MAPYIDLHTIRYDVSLARGPFRVPFRSTFQGFVAHDLVLDLGYKTLKSASKRHPERFVRPSKIFVWEE
jgi:hypothetical protein